MALSLNKLTPRPVPSTPRAPVTKAALKPAPTSSFSTPKSAPTLLRPPPPNAGDLLRKLVASKNRDLLENHSQSESAGSLPGAIVIENPAAVDDSADVDDKRGEAARALLKENGALEREALLKLPKAQREEYLAVRRALLTQEPADPVAALALQTMLFEGALTPDVLQNLQTLADPATPLAEGITRNELLADVVQEIATPEAIGQGNRGTCAPTTCEILLAQNDPAEYVRLITGLASPEGTVTTQGGAVLKREDGVLTDGTSRAVTQQLLAPALMELGDGFWQDYDNSSDQHEVFGFGVGQGLGSEGVDRVLEALFGKDFAHGGIGSAAEKQAAMELVREQLAAGNAVPVGLIWPPAAHKVLAVGLETRDGKEYVRVINPWGQTELIPVEVFQQNMMDINYDPNA